MEAYLDNSATTRVDAQVQELMKKLMDVVLEIHHHVIKRVLWQRAISRKQDRKLLLL